MKIYLALDFKNKEHLFSCLFEVKRDCIEGRYTIKRIIEDNSDGDLLFYEDGEDIISWCWSDGWGSEWWQYITSPREDPKTFNNDEEALLWYKLNH